jgi:hypothetical protein
VNRITRKPLFLLAISIAGSILLGSRFVLPVFAQTPYDIVILNGRVIDPETDFDGISNVGIKVGTIAAITEDDIAGDQTIDATGLIVSPGFIDIHSHSFELTGQRMQAFDGITTALEMESGVLPVAPWYDLMAEEGRVLNYGATAAWTFARIGAMIPEMPPMEPTAEWYLSSFQYPAWTTDVSTDEQQTAILDLLQQGLDDGALGIGVNSGYAPGAGGKELTAVWEQAAANDVPVSTHLREWSNVDPLSSVEGMNTVTGLALATGARTNVCHINSTSLRDGEQTVALLAVAREAGADIHGEAYPYGIGSFPVSSAIYLFDAETFQERIGVDFDAVRLIAKQQQIQDEADIRAAQADDPGQLTILEFLDEDEPQDEAILAASVTAPWIGVASDAVPWNLPDGSIVRGEVWPLPENALSNPRSAGTFSRFLGRWVREKEAFTWPEAIRKVSLIPAQLFDGQVAAMERKGRLQVGMDADITVFDPETILDRATVDQLAQTSEGVRYLVVNGTVLIDDGEMNLDIRPGQPIRRTS